MRRNIEIKCGVNGFARRLFVDGRLVYKSKNLNKVTSRYEQMMKIEDNSERRIEQFKDNPYKIVR